jgi:hypothetical protein
VSNNHLPVINGIELILIKGRASNLHSTSLISSMSLHASLMQYCCIVLMMEGSVMMSSGGFGGTDGLLIFVV